MENVRFYYQNLENIFMDYSSFFYLATNNEISEFKLKVLSNLEK